MLAWLKAAHIAALCVWCAGLVFLPMLFLGRAERPELPVLKRLWRFTWFGYRAVISPAAVLAIATGTGLIFANNVFVPWLFLKLLAVGGMVLLHMSYGHVLEKLADRDRCFPRLGSFGLVVAAHLLIVAVLLLVLGKPGVDAEIFPEWMRRPGTGQELFGKELLQLSSSETMRPI